MASEVDPVSDEILQHPMVRTLIECLTLNEPRFSIIIGNALVEAMVDCIIKDRCKLGNEICKERACSYYVKTIIAYESSLIDEVLFHRMNALRRLRNEAAHNYIFPNDKCEKILAEGAADIVAHGWTSPPPSKYQLLPGTVIMNLWSLFGSTLNPVFKTEKINTVNFE